MAEKLNPPLVVISEQVDKRTFHIIRDDKLIGGTKQRMLQPIIENNPCKEFVYAGPVYGYAQIALSYVTSKLNKKATLFLATHRPRTKLTQKAAKYNPKIVEIGKRARLKDVQREAEEYVKGKKQEDKVCLIPFGLGGDKYVNILADQIKKANTIEIHPKRMWLVAGSATVLNALYKVYPNTFFHVVQVGKKIWPDQMDLSRTKLYISDQKFWETAHIQPPYPTVKTYDAKVWKFVLKYGQDGDYVWNVGGTDSRSGGGYLYIEQYRKYRSQYLQLKRNRLN